MRISQLPVLLLILYLLVCTSPDNPFSDKGNATGLLHLSSESGMHTDTAFIDSTGNAITVRATIFLPKYIKSATVTISDENSVTDTILEGLFTLGDTKSDNRSLDTTLIFPRGGGYILTLDVISDDGISSSDSAVIYLYRKPLYLSELTIDNVSLSPLFSHTIDYYSATVPYETSQIAIRPEAENPYARIAINGRELQSDDPAPVLALDIGTNVIVITTSTDDSLITTVCTLSVKREKSNSPDVTLKSIGLSHGVADNYFHPDSLEYRIILSYEDSVISITPLPTDSTASITIDSLDGPQTVTVGTGTDSVTITVTAADSSVSRSYLLIFRRSESNNTKLARLTPSSGTLFPDFSPDDSIYSLLVPDSVSELEFTAVPIDNNASVTVNAVPADVPQTLKPQAITPFTIVVTAANGSDKHTYSVSATRVGSDVAHCTALKPSCGVLVPVFHFDTLEYALRIPSDSSTIKIKPTAAHNRSTITVNGTIVTSGTWSQSITCKKGRSSAFPVAVTSESGENSKSYQITVNRAYKLSVGTEDSGTVFPSVMVDTYTGIPILLSATPATGYHFTGWTLVDGDAIITAPDSVTTDISLKSDTRVSASFEPDRYYLTIGKKGEGTVTGSDTVYHGTPFSLHASPDNGHFFLKWQVIEGEAVIACIDSATTTVTCSNGNATIEAIFTTKSYLLTITSDEHGSADSSMKVAHGVAQPVTAHPLHGYHFNTWEVTEGEADIALPADTLTSVTLRKGDAAIKAHFTIDRYTLQTHGNEGGSAEPKNDTLDFNTPDSIFAEATDGYHFVKWQKTSGTGITFADSTSARTTVTLTDGNGSVEAVFSINRYQLLTQSTKGGSVEPKKDTIDHGVPDSLFATETYGYHFVKWQKTAGTGITITDPNSARTTITLTDGDAAVEAVFALNRYQLLTGSNEGGSTSPQKDTLKHGVADSVFATSTTGYQFVRWQKTGGTSITIADSSKARTTVTLKDGDAEIEAVFAINRYKFTLAKTGPGEIGVNPQPDDSVSYGDTLTITATSSGSCQPFRMWHRSSAHAIIADSADSQTTVTLTGNATVTAEFINVFDTIYVDITADGAENGVIWKNAFTDLQDAFSCAPEECVILIAEGTYYPSATDRLVSFEIPNKVKIYGGYPNGGGARDISSHATILSGEIQDDNDITNNSRTVVKASDMEAGTLVDGIVIAQGYGDGEAGGGMDIINSSININACYFTENTVDDSGGGAIYFSNGELSISKCRFDHNQCSKQGGAIYSAGNIFISYCQFIENSCKGIKEPQGGALWLKGEAHISHTSFIKNAVTVTDDSYAFGGAVESFICTIRIFNCTFSHNSVMSEQTNANGIGGGIMIYNSKCFFVNNTISLNSVSCSNGLGGGLVNSFTQTDTFSIVNSIIWGNTTPDNIEPNFFYNSTYYYRTSINNCIIEGGLTDNNITTSQLLTDDPLLGALDTTTGPMPFIPIQSNSPAVDQGTTEVPDDVDISTDCRGYPRSDGKPDIGAYEVQ